MQDMRAELQGLVEVRPLPGAEAQGGVFKLVGGQGSKDVACVCMVQPLQKGQPHRAAANRGRKQCSSGEEET